MTRIDQFESVFKSAERVIYSFEKISFPNILLVTDLEDAETEVYLKSVKGFLSAFDSGNDSIKWSVLGGKGSADIGSFLGDVKKFSPDLICTYRNLHSEGGQWAYSLGEHIDILTQEIDVPVLLLPHPQIT